jgi:hypothetical protein
MKEIEQGIARAKRDAKQLRKMRQQGGGPLDELEEILQRNREGLEWLMRIDPARAEEIKAFLAGSEQRMRKAVMRKRMS